MPENGPFGMIDMRQDVCSDRCERIKFSGGVGCYLRSCPLTKDRSLGQPPVRHSGSAYRRTHNPR